MLRWVRRPLVALVVLGAGAAACGGGPSDTERVHTAVEAFGRATAAKDYQRLCDQLLAPDLVQEVESQGLPCEVALQQGLGEVEAPTLTIGRIEVTGDRATADVRSAAAGEPPSRDTLQLVRVGDSWRIASLR
jgi:Putative lumazine-binding